MSFEMFKSGKLHFSKDEVLILRSLINLEVEPKTPRINEVSQIVIETGIKDQDSILRALYTLEGKGLVSPDPEGDFTSSRWKTTNAGVATMDVIESSLEKTGKEVNSRTRSAAA